MEVTDKMTAEEYTIYSAINHADDEWTPEATAALNRIKAQVWDDCEDAMHDWIVDPFGDRPTNPHRVDQ